MTEVGLIPEDWEVKKLGNILKVIGGGAFKSEDNSTSGIKWLKIANVGINKVVWNDENFLPIELVLNNENFLLKEGDYVIALTRPILDGKLKIAKLSQLDVPALLNQRVGKILIEENNDIDYAYFLFQKKSVINSLLQSMAGTDPPNLGNKGIYNVDCATPPTIAEQIAIANALKDTDDLINSLENLITKKKIIKQGTMQELLKPKEGWKKKKLGEVGVTFGGLSGKSKVDFQNEGFPYIPFMNIMANPIINIDYLDFVNIKPTERQNKCQKGDLFFNGSSETPEEVGMCSILLDNIQNLYLNSFCFGFRINDDNEVDGQFLTYLFRSSYGRALIFSSAQGATRYNLSKANFLQLIIDLPNIDKQKEISQFVFLMDSEIDSLIRRLSKYEIIKQGMMQQLLTGKTRLV